MNCRKVQSLISAYVDCELSGLEMLAVRQHLSDCGECTLEFESLLGVKKALGSLCAQRPTSDLANRICARLDQLSLPKGNLILAALQANLTAFPARLRWAAAGLSVFTVLLMLRAGQMSTNQPLLAQLPSDTQLIGTAEHGLTPTIPRVPEEEFVPFGAAPAPASASHHWELSKAPDSAFPSTTLTQTGYTSE
ncbi:MAG TPA: zf-HC2 domain-containing protein [Armatimonadota bacterium]|nr:zf-HC2 domain-containing protein [Armatimonadota bacterium]